VIALLAVGLGAFGGRQAPPDGGALAPSSSAGAGPSDGAVGPMVTLAQPIATPAVPCRPSTKPPPQVFLDVEGSSIPPVVDGLELGGVDVPVETAAPFGELPEDRREEVPSDARVSIRIGGDACALAWSIDLTYLNQSIGLEEVRNPTRDPLVAQQNRFVLALTPFRGQDFNLVARLTYPDAIRREIWPIRILPFKPPMASLLAGGRPADVVPGCDLRLDLANGQSEPMDAACLRSMALAPTPFAVRPGETIQVRFGDGWALQRVLLGCGMIDRSVFYGDPGAGCVENQRSDSASWSFDAPADAGLSSLAIDLCALQTEMGGANQLCGTWFATMDVQSR